MTEVTPPAAPLPPPPAFREALRVWARIGVLGFGGPAGQIALMHRELVERRRWISEDRFLHALNYCMLLPGPEAQQLATYVGWLLHGWSGGLAAGLLFILPGFCLIVALSALYAVFQDAGWLGAVFFGLKAAVLAIVAEAVARVGRRALRTRTTRLLAASAFVALFLFDAPFPAVIGVAALIGFIGARKAQPTTPDANSVAPARSRDALRAAALCALAWAAPVPLLLLAFGWPNVFLDMAAFFSKMAVVTFGGAYAALAYVAQQAVETYGWLKPGEMLDGLALAETTPGPLILVLTFVAFLAGYRNPSGLEPLVAGVLGASVATWVTFAPCFLWIFLGAPYVERLRENAALAGALAAITAAVVGVILNLAVWFALHVLFRDIGAMTLGPLSLPWPRSASLDPAAAALAALAFVALFRFKVGVPTLLVLCGGCGALLRALV